MTSRSATSVFASVLLAAATLPGFASDSPTADSSASKIRVVRLSEAKGAVTMDRVVGHGFERAFANMPIVEGSRVRTDQGVAEVEFEDNSSLRLAPNTVVEFPKLDRLATGATESTVRLVRGTAYVSLVKSKTGNPFSLAFDKQSVALAPGAHVRLDVDESRADLAVLEGSARVEGPAGEQDIARNKTVSFHLADQTQSVEKEIAAQPYDDWDKTATGYHARTASYNALSSTPYSYGLNDMAYYGSFADMGGGCGTMWRPYFASAAWEPYSNGAWAFYQGAGYSWVSPYPWGWTPYHYGSWSFCQGAGWGWLPGGAWNGLGIGSSLIAGAGGVGAGVPGRPPVPVRAPLPGEPTIAAVNMKPLVRSELASPESFTFRKDSAGMGIPREELGKLDKFSRQSMERGAASTHIYLSAPSFASTNVRSPSQSMGAVSMHRGFAPPAGFGAEAGARGGYSGAGSGRMSGAPSSSISRSAGPAPSSASAGGHSK